MSNDTQTKRKFAVTVTLKSGVQLKAECDKFTVRKNGFGDLRELGWENLSTQWLDIDLGEIAAIECDELSA